jgi:hypothetical protein
MNESTLMQLKILVERTVRPVRAGTSCKRRMREELLAHVSGVFEEEFSRPSDEQAALERVRQRFGDPSQLTGQLQASVPASDWFDRFLDWVWGPPGESALRRAVRHALLIQAVALMMMLISFWLVRGRVSELPVLLLQYCGPVTVVFSFVWFVCTLVGEWLRRALHGPTRQPRPRVVAVAVASWLIFLSFIVGPPLLLESWQRSGNYVEAIVSAAILVVWAVFFPWSLAEISAARIRSHEEWASLQID